MAQLDAILCHALPCHALPCRAVRRGALWCDAYGAVHCDVTRMVRHGAIAWRWRVQCRRLGHGCAACACVGVRARTCVEEGKGEGKWLGERPETRSEAQEWLAGGSRSRPACGRTKAGDLREVREGWTGEGAAARPGGERGGSGESELGLE